MVFWVNVESITKLLCGKIYSSRISNKARIIFSIVAISCITSIILCHAFLLVILSGLIFLSFALNCSRCILINPKKQQQVNGFFQFLMRFSNNGTFINHRECFFILFNFTYVTYVFWNIQKEMKTNLN